MLVPFDRVYKGLLGMKLWIPLGALTGLYALGIVSCAAEPEQSSPGTCSLNCSKKRVGAVEYGARALLADKSLDLKCSLQGGQNGIAPHNGPLQVRFLVYEKVSSFTQLPESGTSSGGGNGGGGNGGGTLTPIFLEPEIQGGKNRGFQNPAGLLQGGGGAPLVDIIPKAGIGFEPLLSGSLSVANTNPEFKTSPTEVTPFKFAGVVTPSSEWCTDSCGVATYEFWPNCITGGQTLRAGVVIQNITVDESYSFSLNPL